MHASKLRRAQHGAKKAKMIGIIELADRLGCHPATIRRCIKMKPSGFPLPIKPFGKNIWPEDVIDAYVEQLMASQAD